MELTDWEKINKLAWDLAEIANKYPQMFLAIECKVGNTLSLSIYKYREDKK